MTSAMQTQEIYRNIRNSSFCLDVRSTLNNFMDLASLGIILISFYYNEMKFT